MSYNVWSVDNLSRLITQREIREKDNNFSEYKEMMMKESENKYFIIHRDMYLRFENIFREELFNALKYMRNQICDGYICEFMDVDIYCGEERIDFYPKFITYENPFKVYNEIMNNIIKGIREEENMLYVPRGTVNYSHIKFIICFDIPKIKVLSYISAFEYFKDSKAFSLFEKRNKDKKENTILLVNRFRMSNNVYVFYRINLVTMKIVSITSICPE